MLRVVRWQVFSLMAGAACGQFLAVLVPCVNPIAVTAREGVAGGAQDFAHTAHREGVQLFPLGVAGVNPTAILDNVKRLAVSDNFALGSAECVDFLALFIIDVVPRLCGLDIADFLGLKTQQRAHQGDGDEDKSFHIGVGLFDEFQNLLFAGMRQDVAEVIQYPLQ